MYLVVQPNSMDIPFTTPGHDKIRRKIKQDSHKIFRKTENNMTIIDEYHDDGQANPTNLNLNGDSSTDYCEQCVTDMSEIQCC